MRLTSGVCGPAYITHFLDGRIFNEEVRRRTDQPSLTHIIRTTRLKFCSHIARADTSMDHSRALRACVAPLPKDWNHRSGRPPHTWLRTVESDLAPLNIGLTTAYHRVQNRQTWRTLVGMEMSSTTDKPHDDDEMSFLPPNHQCQTTEGIQSTSH